MFLPKANTALGALLVVSLSGCGGSGGAGDSAQQTNEYGHPGATGGAGGGGGGGGTISAPTGRLARIVDGVAGNDLTVELATTSVTIRSGTYQTNYQALLTDLGGEITETTSLNLLGLPIRLRVTDAEAIFERADAARDIEITVTATKTASIYKALILLVDYGEALEAGVATPVRRYLRLSEMGSNATTNSAGKLVASFRVRSANLGIVMASSNTGNPGGFATYTKPPVDPDSVSATSVDPVVANVTWRARKITGFGFSLAYGVAPVAPLCATAFNVTATETSAAPTVASDGALLYEYTASLTGLSENTAYAIRVCAADTKTPPDYSGPGALTTVTTPVRASAVLSNTPAILTNVTSIAITVGGAGTTHYKFVRTANANCSGVTYSPWIAAATAITDSSVVEGAHRLCVLAKKSDTNIQLVPTQFAWEVDITPPVISNLALVAFTNAPGVDLAEKTSNVALHLVAVISGQSGEFYKVVASGAICSSQVYPDSTGVTAKSGSILADGNYKICVKAVDLAGNQSFGNSIDFTADITLPSFTGLLAMANESVGGYVNEDEISAITPVVADAQISESGTKEYALVSFAVSCASSGASYSTSRPIHTDFGRLPDASYKVCVRAFDSIGNGPIYQNSTAIVLDKIDPVYVSGLLWVGDAADRYINSVERLGTTPLFTVAGANELSTYKYQMMASAGACSSGASFVVGIPAGNDAGFSADGLYKSCVEITDLAGNIAYENSANITLDQTAPVFTSIAFANEAANGYINNAEKNATTDLVGTPVTSGANTTEYVVALASATCSAATGHSSTKPQINDAAMTGDGSWKVCVKLMDTAGNVTHGTSSVVVRDTVAPSLDSGFELTGTAVDSYINSAERSGTTALFTVAVADEPSTYMYQMMASGGTCLSGANFVVEVPTGNDPSFSADGTYKGCVKITDSAENIGYGNSATITLDQTAPVFTSIALANEAANSYINNAEKNATTDLVGTPVTSGASVTEYVVVLASATCSGATGHSLTKPNINDAAMTGDGTWKVCVKLTDTAGNVSHGESSSVIRDIVPPTMNSGFLVSGDASDSYINSTERSGTTPLFTAAVANEPSTYKYQMMASASACSSGSSFVVNIPAGNDGGFPADGTYKGCVEITDLAGNIAYGNSATITLDQIAPVFTSIALANEAVGGYINNAEKDLTTDLVLNPVTSGANVTEYVVVLASATCSGATGHSSAKPQINDAAMTADGSWKVCVKLTDTAGNVTHGASSNVIRDIVPPTMSSGFGVTGNAADSYINSAERSGTTPLFTAAVANEPSTYKYQMMASAGTCSSGASFVVGIPAGNDAGFSADGLYKSCVEITDLAGNIAHENSANITLDTSAPTATMALINAAASDGGINAAEHAAITTPMGAAPSGSSDLAATTYKLIPSATTCGVALSFGASIPAADSADFIADGNYVICMRIVDTAGNVGYASSPTIILDTLAPTLSSAALANQAVDGYINDAEKAATAALMAAATASESATITYVAALSAATCSGASGYGSNIPQTDDGNLASDGSFKVCVKMVDSAGNAGFGASANIIRDTALPTLSSGLALSGDGADGFVNNAERSGATALVTAPVANEASTYRYILVAGSATCAAATGYGNGIPAGNSGDFSADGNYKVCAEMTDAAGNKGFANSSVIVLDAIAPTATTTLVNAASDALINASEYGSSALAMAAAATGSEALSASTYKLILLSATCGSSVTFASAIPPANSGDFGADADYKICMRIVDIAGNIGYSSSATIALDTTFPTFTGSIALANQALDGYINDIEKTATNDLIATPSSSGATSTEYVVAANGATCSATSGYASTKPRSDDAAMTSDGSWKVCVKIADSAGNRTYGSSPLIVRDTLAATLASGFTWTGSAWDTYLNASERSGTAAILTAAVASETATFKYVLIASSGACSAATFASAALPAADSGDVTGDGAYKACVEINDAAGNKAFITSASNITLDTSAPTATMAFINAAATDGVISSSEHASNTAAMGAAPSGSADLATATYKLIPSSTTCGSALSFAGGIPGADSSDFTSDGTYIICMRLIDNAGNVGYSSSSNLTLDTGSPTLSLISLANQALDGYINSSESSATNALTGSATASESSTITYVLAANSAACAAQSGYSGAIPASDNSGFSGDGSWKVCVKMVDVAGNSGYGASGVIVRDTVAPTLSSGLAWSGPASNLYLNTSERAQSTAIVTAAVANETSTYQYLAMAAASTCSGGTFSSSSVPGGDTADITADGSWKVCLKMVDTAGNIAFAATSSNLAVDTVNPALTSLPLINDALDGYIITSERSSTAAMAGPLTASADLAAGSYKLVPSSTSCGVALSFAGSIPTAASSDFSADQTYYICVRLEDNAGNVAYASAPNIILDTSAPVFTSIALANGAADGYINDSEKAWTSAVAGSAVSSGSATTQYVVAANAASCSAASGYGSSIPQINDAGFSADGSWKICVKLADAAGNITYASSSAIIRDVVNPALSSGLALQAPAADAYLNTSDRTSTNALVSAASVSEASAVQYTVATGSCSSASGYASSIPAANTAGITGDGTWKVCVKMTDSAGNIAYDNSANIVVDTSGPVFTSLALANAATDGYLTIAENVASTNLAGSLVGSGYATDDYKLVPSSTTCGTPLVFSVMPKSDSSDFSGDGTYKVCVRLVDASGNLTYGATNAFTLDTNLPSFTSLALANTALDGYLNASDRLETSGITGTLTASGQNTTQYKVALASAACSSLSSWSSAAILADDAGVTSDNSWKVCVKLSDTAGNVTYGASSNFVVDTVSPSLSAALTLAGAATDGYINASEVSGSAAVIGTPSFNESATVTYIVSTSAAACSAGSGWNSSIPLGSTFDSAPFNSDGVYKVCVRGSDAAGNVGYHASPTITRDTTGPSFTSLALANAASDGYLNASDRTLTTVVGDTLVAEAGATATYASVSSVTTCNSSLTYSSTVQQANDGAFAADATYKVCVNLVDVAGNNGYGSSSNFVVDSTSASFVSAALANVAVDNYLSIADRLSSLALVADAISVGADATYYAAITLAATCNATVTFGGAGVKPAASAAAITSDGMWKMCVKVTDNAGNSAGYGSSGSFTVDTASPAASVTSTGSLSIATTSGSTTNLEGAISDASPSAGISGVTVSVEGFNGSCLNNSKTDFSAVCPNWMAGTSTASTWSLPVDDGMFLKGASYTVSVLATDLAGNQQSSGASGVLTWSAPEGSDLWNSNVTFNGSNGAQAMASAVDSQGRLVVVGYDTSGATRGRVKRYTRHGIADVAIDITIGDGTANYVAYGVAIGSSDSIFVVGSKFNGSNNDWFIKKYSAVGTEDTISWNKALDGTRNDDDGAYAIALASDGSVVVGGYSRRSVATNTGDDWRIVKYSSDGVQSCAQSIDVSGQRTDDRIKGLVIRNSTSRIYVAGYSDATGTSRGWGLGEFNLSTCALVNSTVINRGLSDEAYSIAMDSTGQLIVAGKTSEYAGTTPDPWIEVMNTSFASVCTIRPDVSAVSEALTVAVDSTDSIYVGGYRTAANENWWLRKFSSACTEDTSNWNKTLNGTGNGADRIQSISISSGTNDADNIYAVGWGYGAVSGSGNNDWWVKKYSGAP